MKFIALLCTLFLSLQAQAYLTSDWDVSLGMTSLKYNFQDFSESVESVTTLEVNYSVYQPSINSALTLSFQEVFVSGGGQQLPFNRIAVGMRYYIFGVNGLRTILDSLTEAKVWRPAPFVGFNLGLANLSVGKKDEGAAAADKSLNASLMDINVRGGVEVPMASDLLMVGQVSIGSSLAAESSLGTVSYTTMNLFAGVRFVGF